MSSTNNDSYKNAALKVFAQLGQLIEDDEKLIITMFYFMNYQII
jgi:hypothetical protein